MRTPFQYSSNVYSRVLYGSIAILIAYFAISMNVINSEHYVPDPPLSVFVSGGLIVSLLLFFC